MTDPVFTASHGIVLRRGIYLAEPSKLLAVFMASAEGGDWFSPRAAELADELRDAISIAEAYHEPLIEGIAA